MFKLLKKPQCQKLSKFSTDRQTHTQIRTNRAHYPGQNIQYRKESEVLL